MEYNVEDTIYGVGEIPALLADRVKYFVEASLEMRYVDHEQAEILLFCAIELLLKLRIVCEHWSLICSDSHPSFDKFLSGETKTRDFSSLIKVLEHTVQDGLPEDIRKEFNKLRTGRNKLMHFFDINKHGSSLTPDQRNRERLISYNRIRSAIDSIANLIGTHWRSTLEGLGLPVRLWKSRAASVSSDIEIWVDSVRATMDPVDERFTHISICLKCNQNFVISKIEGSRVECKLCGFKANTPVLKVNHNESIYDNHWPPIEHVYHNRIAITNYGTRMFNLSYWIDDRIGHYRPDTSDWLPGETRIFHTKYRGTPTIGEDDLYLFYSSKKSGDTKRRQTVLRFISTDTGKKCAGFDLPRFGRPLEIRDESVSAPNMEQAVFSCPKTHDTSRVHRYESDNGIA